MDNKLSILPFVVILIEALALVIGGVLAIYYKQIKGNKIPMLLSFAAGSMLYVSVVKFLPAAKDLFDSLYTPRISSLYLAISLFSGILITTPVDYLLSTIHKYRLKQEKEIPYNKIHWLVFSSISMHNFFEGVAIFLALISSPTMILPLLLAIFAHNVPEGSVIAVLIYSNTKSKRKALFYCALSGLSGFLGMLFAYILLQNIMSMQLLAFIKGILSGLLINTAISELFTRSMLKGEYHLSVRFLIFGMIFMAALLILKG